MGRDGNIKLGFNQPMKVPSFIDQDGGTSSGRLLSGSDKVQPKNINVNEVVKLQFLLKSEESDIQYSLQLQNWNSGEVSIKINFTDPLLISQGESRDSFFMQIDNPDLFVSQKSGKSFNKKDQEVIK